MFDIKLPMISCSELKSHNLAFVAVYEVKFAQGLSKQMSEIVYNAYGILLALTASKSIDGNTSPRVF